MVELPISQPSGSKFLFMIVRLPVLDVSCGFPFFSAYWTSCVWNHMKNVDILMLSCSSPLRRPSRNPGVAGGEEEGGRWGSSVLSWGKVLSLIHSGLSKPRACRGSFAWHPSCLVHLRDLWVTVLWWVVPSLEPTLPFLTAKAIIGFSLGCYGKKTKGDLCIREIL